MESGAQAADGASGRRVAIPVSQFTLRPDKFPVLRDDVTLKRCLMMQEILHNPDILLPDAVQWHAEDSQRSQARDQSESKQHWPGLTEEELEERLGRKWELEEQAWNQLSDWEKVAHYVGSLVSFVKYQDDMHQRRDAEKAKSDSDPTKRKEFPFRGSFSEPDKFPHWDINCFASCLAASSGPQDDPNVGRGSGRVTSDEYYISYYPGTYLMELTNCRKHTNIGVVYALGHAVGHCEGDGVNTDFSDYFRDTRGAYDSYDPPLEGYPTVSFRTRRHVPVSPQLFSCDLDVRVGAQGLLGYFSRVNKSMRIRNVTIRDGSAFHHTPFDVVCLYEDVVRSVRNGERILFHCASGRGRSGLMVLACAVFLHAAEVLFNQEDAGSSVVDPALMLFPMQDIVERCYGLLESLRDVRPGLVESPRQFFSAMNLAVSLVVLDRHNHLYACVAKRMGELQVEMIGGSQACADTYGLAAPGSKKGGGVLLESVSCAVDFDALPPSPLDLNTSLEVVRYLAVEGRHAPSLHLIGHWLTEADAAITITSHARTHVSQTDDGMCTDDRREQLLEAENWLALAYIFAGEEHRAQLRSSMRRVMKQNGACTSLSVPTWSGKKREGGDADVDSAARSAVCSGVEAMPIILGSLNRDGACQFYLRLHDVLLQRFQLFPTPAGAEVVTQCVDAAYRLASQRPKRNQYLLQLEAVARSLRDSKDTALSSHACTILDVWKRGSHEAMTS